MDTDEATVTRALQAAALQAPAPREGVGQQVLISGRRRHRQKRRTQMAAGGAVTFAVVAIGLIVSTADPSGSPERAVDRSAVAPGADPQPQSAAEEAELRDFMNATGLEREDAFKQLGIYRRAEQLIAALDAAPPAGFLGTDTEFQPTFRVRIYAADQPAADRVTTKFDAAEVPTAITIVEDGRSTEELSQIIDTNIDRWRIEYPNVVGMTPKAGGISVDVEGTLVEAERAVAVLRQNEAALRSVILIVGTFGDNVRPTTGP